MSYRNNLISIVFGSGTKYTKAHAMPADAVDTPRQSNKVAEMN